MLRKPLAALAAVLLLAACQQPQPAATSTPPSPTAWGVSALPDAQFAGFAQTVNDFQVQSGQLALSRSSNQNVRGYATRAVSEFTTAAQSLERNRTAAGVTYAPEENVRSIANDAMSRLNSLRGSDFDRAYSD